MTELRTRFPNHLLLGALCCGIAAANAVRVPVVALVAAAVALLAAATVSAPGHRVGVLALALALAGWWWGSARLDALDRSVLLAEVGRAERALVVVTGPPRSGGFSVRAPGLVMRFGRLRPHEAVLLELPLGRSPPRERYSRSSASSRCRVRRRTASTSGPGSAAAACTWSCAWTAGRPWGGGAGSAERPTGFGRGSPAPLLSGCTATGVRWSVLVVPEHDAYQRRASGQGWRALADFFNESGVVSPYGNHSWTTGAIQKIIRNRVYLGEARSGRHVNADAHEAIVSRAEWEAAQSARIGASPRVGDGLLLAGLVRCAGCRYLMKADHMRDRDGSQLGLYRCRGRSAAGQCSGGASVLARVLDPFIEQQFIDALAGDGPIGVPSASSDEVAEATLTVERAEQELDAYRDDTRIAELLDRTEFHRGLEARAGAVDEARDHLADAQRRAGLFAVPGTPGDLVKAWPELTIAERRELLSATVDTIFVRSGRESIDQRALILWRGEAPHDLPGRGRRVPLASFVWPSEAPTEAGVTSRENVKPGTP